MKNAALAADTAVHSHAIPHVQRACACGASKGVEDQCPACAARARLGVQPKLTVNKPGDRYEQEADRIADRVVNGSVVGPVGAAGATLQRMEEDEDEDEVQTKPAGLQRMEEEEELQMKPAGLQRMEEDEEDLQMKSTSSGQTNAAVSQAAAAVSGSGAPLSHAERGYFEPRLGRDLSDVRVHDNARAGAAAKGINARAYTLKNHVAFAPGTRDFASTEGRRLMAHELVHTAQQDGARLKRLVARKAAPKARRQRFFHPLLMNFIERVENRELPLSSASERQRRRWSRRASRALRLLDRGRLPPVTDETETQLKELKYFIKGETPIEIVGTPRESLSEEPKKGISDEAIEALRNENKGVPEQGHECAPDIDLRHGNRLRDAAARAIRMATAAERNIRKMDEQGSAEFKQVFGEPAQIKSSDGSAIFKIVDRFSKVAEGIPKTKVSWGSNPTPEPREKPSYQKYVCYNKDKDPFACHFSDNGEKRTYHAFTDGTPGADVTICNAFWELSDDAQAASVLHEHFHYISGITEDVYRHESRFATMTPDDRMKNPDHYVLFSERVLQGNPRAQVEPSIGCSEEQAEELPKIVEEAATFMDRVAFKVRPQDIACWFGEETHPDPIRLMMFQVRDFLLRDNVLWSCAPSSVRACGERKAMAFAGSDERGRVVGLCPIFWQPSKRTRAKMTLIHELFHQIGANHTKKVGEVYKLPELRRLACEDPKKASDNSENFVQSLLDADRKAKSCPPCPK